MSKSKIIKPFFKIHKKNGHPAYIYAEYDDQYKYIGITHAEITQGIRNKKIKFNSNNKDPRTCYARPFSTHDKKSIFKKRKLKNYKIHRVDKKIFRSIKKKYRE